MTITATLKLRDRLSHLMLDKALGASLSDRDSLEGVSRLLADELSVDLERIRRVIVGFPLGVLVPELADTIAFRLAGRLAVEPGLVPFSSSAIRPRVGMEIRECFLSRSQKGRRPRALLSLRVLQGELAGNVFSKSFSLAFLPIWARDMGFGKSYRRHKWRGNPGEFVLLWFTADASLSSEYRLVFERYTVTSECMRHNKAVIKARLSSCPEKYVWPCHHCPIGYKDCFRGTHAVSYPLRECAGLPPDRLPHTGYFRPTSDSRICVECLWFKRNRR